METSQKATTGSPIQIDDLWKMVKAAAHQGNSVPEVIEISEAPEAPSKVIEAEVSSTTQLPNKTVLAESIAAAFPDVTPPDLTGGSALSTVVTPSDATVPVTKIDRFPHNLPEKLGLFLGQSGKAYAVMKDVANHYVLAVGSKKTNNLIRKLAQSEGITLRKSDLADISHILQAEAETAGVNKNVWCRVAPATDGIIVDLGDDQHTHVQITAGKVEIIRKGSPALFYRTPMTQPMVMPAKVGNLDLLKKYLNLHSVSMLLLIAWLSYILAHPKIPTSKFVILVLRGNQGSGKSLLCYIIKSLIDPSKVGLQVLPSNPKDIAISAQNSHVICYDNVREFSQLIADTLCVASTGGAMCQRQLYTDDEQSVLNIHVAVVLNGIHSFIDQPDLAQRCIPLELLPFNESMRKSEAQFMREFQQDLPVILRGLLDLIAKVFTHLPTAEVTNPERMYDFVQWLAAMEQAQGCRAGDYQALYSNVINEGQLDSILDNVLAATVLEFAHGYINGNWSGTPAGLLIQLNKLATKAIQRLKEWPSNAIALSKRLIGLQASLRTQGVTLELYRGKERTITITSTVTIAPTATNKLNGANNDEY